MNFRHLQYFVAVAELGSFSQAAEACFVSQPALSMQLKKLEESLGIELFERNNRNVWLTQAGDELLPYARRVLQAVDALKAHAIKGQQQPLRLGVIPTLAPYLLPQLINYLHNEGKSIPLQLSELKTDVCLSEIRQGQLDAALLAIPVHLQELVGEKLAEEEFVLALSKETSVDYDAPLPLHAIPEEQLLLLEEGHCLREHTLDACQNIQLKQHETFRGTSLNTLLHMIALGEGMTLLPCLAQNIIPPNVYCLPLQQPLARRGLALVWRRSSSRVEELKQFAALVRKSLKGIKGIHLYEEEI